MAGTLSLARTGVGSSTQRIRNLVLFQFPRIAVNQMVSTQAIRLNNVANTGEVIVAQRPASGSTAAPRIRYQFVDATTGRPVSNAVTVSGTRIVVLPFTLARGTVRLQITNTGTGPANVSGAILVF